MSEAARKPAGVQNVQRRTWDKDEARERWNEREQAAAEGRKPKNQMVIRESLNKSNLIARDVKTEIESRVGTRMIVTEANRGGFQCRETGVVLRDSHAYLDHINGRKQLAARGVAIDRVEHASLKTVKERLAHHKRERMSVSKTSEQTWDARVKQAEKDEEARRVAKKARREAEKKARKEAAAAEAQEGIDPEMAAMMGFSGFGGSKKN